MRAKTRLLTAVAAAATLGIGIAIDRGVDSASAQVRVTAEQLLINQRISQAGVRRSNQALTLLAPLIPPPNPPAPAPGWPTTAIANNAITTAKLANGAVTQADLAPAVQAQIDNLFAVVAGAAPPGATTLVRSSGATGAAREGAGNYSVTFNQNVSQCAYVATPGDPGSAGAVPPLAASVSGQAGNPNGVVVRIARIAGALAGDPVDTSFHLVVLC
jgi:hypothetical protein